MARVYAEVNQNMPRSYWDYDSVNISELHLPCNLWGTLPTDTMSRLGRAGELRGRPKDWYAKRDELECYGSVQHI